MARRRAAHVGNRKAFDESKHKRAAGGRFGDKPATGAAPVARQRGAVGAAHAVFERMVGKPRSEILAAAAAVGINRNTASTQLGAWQRARAARELAAAGGDTSKAARQAAAARALGVKPSATPQAAPKAHKAAATPTVPKNPSDSVLVNGNAPDSYKLKPNERPVAAVHRIATLMQGRPRAEVIATLSAAGVNRSTASVQYSAWLRAQGGARALKVAPTPEPTLPPAPTPVAAPKAPIAPPKTVRRHPIIDNTLHKPKQGTPEREFHDKLVKAASVFPNSTFVAGYHNGKITHFMVRGGEIDNDGQQAVRINRTFSGSTVDHEFFRVEFGQRGNGATKTFLAESVAEYKAAGYNSVKVHANIDVGGYAWLRYGFQPNRAGKVKLDANVHAKLNWNDHIKASLSSTQIAEIKRLSTSGKHDMISAMTTPIKLPNGTSVPIGRYLYLHTDWEGSLPLKDGPAYDTFKRYAGGKS